MSGMRMAGQRLVLGGVLGATGAFGADAIAHDEMDRVAQDYKDFAGLYGRAPETVRQAYAEVFGKGEMSNMDRLVATGILSGSIPAAKGDGPLKVDTKAGGKAIELAGKIREANPELSEALAAVAKQEMGLFVKEALMRERGMDASSADVVAAAEQGAGVSAIPPILGGLALGSLGAVAPGLVPKRFGGRS